MSTENDGLRKTAKSPYWFYRFTEEGRRFERSTGETSRSKARSARSRLIADARAEIKASRETLDWKQMSFTSALTAYINSDPKRDTRFLDRLLVYFDETPLGEINNTAMARAANALYQGRTAGTIRRQLYVPVNAIINFVKDDKLRAPKGDGQRTIFFTPEQAEALIRQLTTQPNPYTPALVTFLIGQGARMGETMALQAEDVRLDGKTATLRKTKNGNERTLSLQQRTISALSTLPNINNKGPVFRRVDGKAYKERERRGGHIRNPFAYAVGAIGLDPKLYTPHVCRHTWATWHYAVKRDVLLLKEQGGWQSNEYQRYVKIGYEGLADEVLEYGWYEGRVNDKARNLVYV